MKCYDNEQPSNEQRINMLLDLIFIIFIRKM